jgi:hypothetical protein
VRKFKSYCFKADPRLIELLDLIAIRMETTRGALIRALILNFVTDHFTEEKPSMLKYIETGCDND